MGKVVQATSFSERRACAPVGLARDNWRCPPQRARAEQDMIQKIVELAHERRRFGYRRNRRRQWGARSTTPRSISGCCPRHFYLGAWLFPWRPVASGSQRVRTYRALTAVLLSLWTAHIGVRPRMVEDEVVKTQTVAGSHLELFGSVL